MDPKEQKTPNQPVSQPKDEDIDAISLTENPEEISPKDEDAAKSAADTNDMGDTAEDNTLESTSSTLTEADQDAKTPSPLDPAEGAVESTATKEPADATETPASSTDDTDVSPAAKEPEGSQDFKAPGLTEDSKTVETSQEAEKPWPTSAVNEGSSPTSATVVSSDTPAAETKNDASMAPGDDDLTISAKPLTPNNNDLLGDMPSAGDLGHPEGVLPLPPTTPPKRSPHRWLLMMIVGVLLLAVAGGAYAAYKATRKETAKELPHIKVGVMMAFSGGSSSMGYGAMKGIQLAKKQLGADNIEITQMDSKCDPKAAADAIKKLIAQRVAAIIGEGCSSASVAALPAANNSKTVMISPSASSTALSIPDDYFFRVVPPDTFQGEYVAQAIYDKGIRTVAVFYTNEPYGSSMNKVFQERFEALGGKVVATASGEPDVIDLKNQMTELKAANPQAIFFAPNSVVSGTAAMKIGREMGVKAPYYGADILYNTTIIDDAPTATDGLTITSFPTGSKPFKQALMNMNDQVNEQLYAAPQAYDALRAIYIATQRGASTGEEIKKELPSISFDGVSARIKFDLNGEISDKSYKYDLLQVKNGQFVTVE